MASQPSSYYPSDDQCLLFHQHFSSPKQNHRPSSHLLPDNSTTTVAPTVTSFSDLIKVEQMRPVAAQTPYTILPNSDASLMSADLFTSATATTDIITNHSSNMLTTPPQPIPGTIPTYMNDPVTASTAVGSPNRLYDFNSSSILSTSSMDSLLAIAPRMALDENTAVSKTLHSTSTPFIYSNTSIYENGNNQIRHRQTSVSSNFSTDKTHSFVNIPGLNQRKRPRRRYDEIERLYHCTYPGCKKSYGTLNHLNSHVLMQNHGPKRHPAEFKEMRKERRRQRKQKEEQRKLAEKYNKQLIQPPSTLPAAFQPPSTNDLADFPSQSMLLSSFY